MPLAGTVTYKFPDDTKSLYSKDFSNPLSSIARRRGTVDVLDTERPDMAYCSRVRRLYLRRMWDSNPRVTSLPPDGFQDRSLKPDLGNPPNELPRAP